ncbi:MAG: four helix bundle protein [Bacteroidetes bacterium]|nr:four helix bundle protein [Bacteroidota bacterium]
MNEKSKIISEEFLLFATSIISVVAGIANVQVRNVIGYQLIKSGSSAGANYEEACGAESKADFIHKLHIVYKELRESNYWIKIIKKSGISNSTELDAIFNQSEKLLKIIGKSLITSKKNRAT